MFEAWARALYTRRRLTLGIALVLVAFAAAGPTGGRRGRCAGCTPGTGSGKRFRRNGPGLERFVYMACPR